LWLNNNYIKIKFFNKSESIEFIQKKFLELKLKIDYIIIKKIYNFSGGNFSIILKCSRLYKKHKNLNKVVKSEELLKYLRLLWSRFSTNEQNFIKSNIITGEFPPNQEMFNYLKDHNLIINKKLKGDWFKIIFNFEKQEKIEFTIKNNAMFLGEISIEEYFSKNEFKIIKNILENPDFFIKKEQIYQILWGTNYKNKYSDWAIDQTVSRIRKKLGILGVSGKVLKTLKKKGLKFFNCKIIRNTEYGIRNRE